MKPVTTMRQMSSIRKKASVATLALLLGTGAYSSALFGFNISETNARWENSAIQVTVNAEIELSQDVIDAIANFPITITTRIKIYRERNNYWDDLIVEFEVDDVISYRSTYQIYQLKSLDERISGTYKTLEDALKALRKTRVFEIAVAEEVLTDGESYRGKCKVFLRQSKLPSLLRKRVFFQKSWRLGSSWKLFNLQ